MCSMNNIIDCHCHAMTSRILNEYLNKANDERTLIIIRGDIPLFPREYFDFNTEDWHNILKKITFMELNVLTWIRIYKNN